MLLFVSVLALWSSCSKNEALEDIEIPTPINPSDDDKDDQFMVVCEHVSEVANSVVVYYNNSKTIAEMEKHLDEIKKIKYVENAYASGTGLFVEIKDYGMICYYFAPNTNSYHQGKSRQFSKKRITREQPKYQYPSHVSLYSKSIAIINQAYRDEVMSEAKNCMSDTRNLFGMFGYDVSPVVIEPDVDFFQNGIFDYDIVFLQTHGGYNKEKNLYYFLTSEAITETANLDPEKAYSYKDIPRDKVFISARKETRNGREMTVWYAVVTDRWISESSRFFPNPNNTVVFNGMCLSMCGPNPETRDSISYHVAKIFTDKGAGVYLGYDESNSVGHLAGSLFLHKLFSGMSIERAYEDLPFELRHDYEEDYDDNNNLVRSYWADLILYPNPKDISYIRKAQINDPFFDVKYSDQSTENELKVILQQKAYYSYVDVDDDYYYLSTLIPQSSPVRYGFVLSETDQIKDAVEVCRLGVRDNGFEQYMTGEKSYSLHCEYTLTGEKIKPETTYYYWPYFYDGEEYYTGQRNSFRTRSINLNGKSEGGLPDVPGTDL